MAMTGDNGRGMTDQERDEFLQTGKLFAKVATTMDDGWPVLSPVWYLWDGSSFLVVSKANTSLVQNLRRDPRCGVLVDNIDLPYMRVSVRGEARCRRGTVAGSIAPSGVRRCGTPSHQERRPRE